MPDKMTKPQPLTKDEANDAILAGFAACDRDFQEITGNYAVPDQKRAVGLLWKKMTAQQKAALKQQSPDQYAQAAQMFGE